MNRTVLFGVVIFFAVVAIALMGSDNQAVAGHGCHGCGGSYGYACGGYACDGCFGCGGVAYRAPACGGCYAPCGGYGGCAGVVRRHHGLFQHRRAVACYGVAAPCCGPVVYGCGGMVVPMKGGPVQKSEVQKVEVQKEPVKETSVIAPTASLYPSRVTYSRVVFRR